MILQVRRVIAGVWLLGLVGASHAELKLMCHVGDRLLPVAGIENGRPTVVQDGRPVAVPPEAVYSIEGDLKAETRLVSWSPPYGLSSPDVPDRRQGEVKREGWVGVGHLPVMGGRARSSEVLALWPDAAAHGGLFVGGWVVRGKFVHVAVEAKPPATKTHPFVIRQVFALEREETDGQGVLLFWSEGRFLAPVARFKDAVAQRAFEAMLADDLAGFRTALDRLSRVDVRGARRTPLLHYAAEAGAVEAMNLLLERGANQSQINDDGMTALHWAASHGRLRAVERLLAGRAPVNLQASDGATPLLVAMANGHPNVASALLGAGAAIDVGDQNFRSPLSVGIDEGLAEIVATMAAKAPARIWASESMPRVLVTQAAKGHTAMVRLLVAKGVSLKGDDRGQTALMAGATDGDPEIAAVLLRAGTAINAISADGRTALLNACQAGNLDYAAALVAAGADPRVRAAKGPGCLDYAALGDAPELIELLLAHGGEWSTKDADAIAPLDLALLSGSERAARALVAHGARVNLASKRRDLLLQAAVQLDLAEVVESALAGGWPAGTEFHADWPARRVAELFGAKRCLAALQSAGAPEIAPGLPPVVPLRELDARPKLIEAFDPEDPRDVEGNYPATEVEVEVLVDGQGRVLFPRIISAKQGLGLSTLQAVTRWRFTPVTRGGARACVRVVLPIGYPSSEERALDVEKVDQAPEVVSKVFLPYPKPQVRTGVEGRVEVRFTVDTEGRVRDLRVITSTDRAFEVPALEAIAQWTFKPGRRGGKPVNTRLTQIIVFALGD